MPNKPRKYEGDARQRAAQARAAYRAADPERARRQTREAVARYDERYPGKRAADAKAWRAAQKERADGQN